jgi:DNA-binding winged helix-turn-helix (wHTH) protein
MTDNLTTLLLRLSEAGEPAIVWGRQAKPYLSREFDQLLARGILIEEAQATDWDVCASCECGLDVRPIQQIDGRFIAVCPFDRGSDSVLDAEDLRSFRIVMPELMRAIATASGLGQKPALVMPGVWHLGVAPAKRGLFMAFTRDNILVPGLISSLRTIGDKLPLTIVAPTLPAAELLRFVESGIHYVATKDAFSTSGPPFALDGAKLIPQASIAARCTLVQERSEVIFDGHVIALSPISFKLLWLLAETVICGGGIANRRNIEQQLWNTTVSKTAVADAIRNLRDALTKIGAHGKKLAALIQSISIQGYMLKIDPADIRLVR